VGLTKKSGWDLSRKWVGPIEKAGGSLERRRKKEKYQISRSGSYMQRRGLLKESRWVFGRKTKERET
jgi:hypothetical protein